VLVCVYACVCVYVCVCCVRVWCIRDSVTYGVATVKWIDKL